MGTALSILGIIFIIASVVCNIIVLVDAFRNEVWKGILGFFCSLYLLVYAFTDYQGDNKMVVILVWLLGAAIGAGLITMGASMSRGG